MISIQTVFYANTSQRPILKEIITNAVHDCVISRKIVCHIFSGTNRQSRLQQLIDWCGGEHFSGCLIFDECHKAKHFVPVSDLYRIKC